MDNLELFEKERQAMVSYQIEKRGIREPRLLAALRSVPRHCFIPEMYRTSAYEDRPLPIGFDQTISQPYIVALMTNLLQLTGSENILEIGTGSGYQAAVLSRLARQVHTLERLPALAERARLTLQDLGYTNVTVYTGDGSLGLPEAAPYQGIIVTAAAPRVPPPLMEQLDDGGRLVLPAGERFFQELEIWQRTAKGYDHDTIIPVAFVPLRGQWGWSEGDEGEID